MRLTLATAVFHQDGRIRGSYVYMLLCRSADGIHIKVGMSDHPLKRLQGLLTSCPLHADTLATVELPTRRTALRFEKELHCVLAKWRSSGREWFLLSASDKAEFNALIQIAAVHFVKPSWPMRWQRHSVQALLSAARQRRAMFQRRAKKRGRAYMDFTAASKS